MPVLLQCPHAANFIFAERFKCRLRHGDNRQRFTQRVEHLGAVPIFAVAGDVVFHQLDDVFISFAVYLAVV